MHHMAVALDEELIGDGDRAGFGDAPDIVAAQIEQHQMLGAFLRIGHQFFGEALVVLRRFPARPRARDGPDGDFGSSRRRTRISGLEPTMAKPGKFRK